MNPLREFRIKIVPVNSVGDVTGIPVSGVWSGANAVDAKQEALDEFGDGHKVVECFECQMVNDDFLETQDCNFEGENEPNSSWAGA